MKKVKFTGTVETFYFVPNCDEETAVIYLSVTSEQKCPNGRTETLVPPKRMRFMLSGREADALAKGKTATSGDEMTIYATEDADGNLSYSIGLIKSKTPIIDAEDYVKHLKA